MKLNITTRYTTILYGLFTASCMLIADDSVKTYKTNDVVMTDIMNGGQNGSEESKRIKRECVGEWIYDHNVAKANVDYRIKRIVISEDGSAFLEYHKKGATNAIMHSGSIHYIHRIVCGSTVSRPTLLIRQKGKESEEIVPLVDLEVNYDNRAPTDERVLRYRDLDGNYFVFLRKK